MMQSPPAPVGTMHGSAEKGFEDYAWEQLGRDDLHTAVFGHTHSAFARKRDNVRGTLLNSGTWTGAVLLDDLPNQRHDTLVNAAKNPNTQLTYLRLNPDTGEASRGVVGGIVSS
jgi:predicted phosphodiesterase